MSLPSRERGLKHPRSGVVDGSRLSLPSRERGLKQKIINISSSPSFVAPFAGTWIATQQIHKSLL